MQKTRDVLIRTAEGVMSLLVVFLMLAGTVVCSGRLLGVDFFARPELTNRDLLPPPDVLRTMDVYDYRIDEAGLGLWQLTSRRGESVGMLVCSRPYAGDAVGFAGPTPVWVHIDGEGRVRSIVPMDNAESARFFNRAIDGGILARWIGAPAVGADSVSLDAVTGATYSSNALTANVKAACAAYAGATEAVKTGPPSGGDARRPSPPCWPWGSMLPFSVGARAAGGCSNSCSTSASRAFGAGSSFPSRCCAAG